MNQERCGCCEGLEKLTPMLIANRPGLDTLAYRVGTYATFLETMKARLSSLCLGSEKECQDGKGPYPLQSLTTRDANDSAIALLHAWATAADVLTFYQERIANEGYLRTATERRSILELARLVGYKLRPGVAASVYLAFTLENGYEVEIPAGTRAQSVPSPDELPQFFETAEPLRARAEWNQLQPRLTRPQLITEATDTLYFQGTATNLAPNDPLLLVFGTDSGQQVLRRVESVEPQPAEDRTKVTLQEALPGMAAPLALAVPDIAGIISDIQRVAEKYFDLDTFNVSSSTQTAQQVVGLLRQLLDDLKPDLSLEALAALLRNTVLPPLRERHEVAGRLHWTNLESWIGGLVAELEEIEQRLAPGNAAATAVNSPNGVGSSGNPLGSPNKNNSSAFASLGPLLDPLSKPPSLQPANQLRLERNVTQIFATEADMAPRLLISLRPALRPLLYQAWRNVPVTEPAPIEVYTFRVRAAPFGHNAPLRQDHFDEARNLVIYDEWEIYDPLNQEITPPTADFVACPEVGEAPLTVQFVDRSTGYVAEWEWNFGDGSPTSAAQDPPHTFDEPGTYTVTLTVRSSSGSDTITKSVVVTEAAPISAAFTANPVRVTVSFPVQFTDHSTGEIEEWSWDFGDGATSNEQNPSHAFTQAGMYTVTLTVTGPAGQSSAEAIIIVEFPGPIIVGMLETQPTAAAAPLAPPHHQPSFIYLDSDYDILPGSWVAIEKAGSNEPIIVKLREDSVTQRSLAAYGLTGKTTGLYLGEETWFEDISSEPFSTVRGTTVHTQSEALTLAEEPIDPVQEAICGRAIELEGLYDGLGSGRWLIVSGERTDIQVEPTSTPDRQGASAESQTGTQSVSGVSSSELVMIAGIEQGFETDLPGEKTHTRLILANDLAYCYKRDTVTLYGNVVKATHGETREEVLGSGDGSQGLQQFALKQSPLTYLAAPTPAGAESTLQVYVNDIRWHEADSLAELRPNDRRYITHTDNENKTTIIFGNGERGARLSTGLENVKSVYRFGIGKPGNVVAEQISLLATRPLGVKSVINPLRASGGADRESRDQARRNAPLAVMALNRLVSVQDYQDFARTFAGIGKASAARLSDARRELVHVTIAAADDIPIDVNSDLYGNLRQALHQYGDPFQPIQVVVRELMLLVISANVRLLPDYQWESVEPQIRAALLEAFSFERRELGQNVLLSEVISVIQTVAGVAYVDVDILDSVPETITPEELESLAEALQSPEQPKKRIVVNMARIDPAATDPAQRILPAQVAYLNPEVPDTLILTERSL